MAKLGLSWVTSRLPSTFQIFNKIMSLNVSPVLLGDWHMSDDQAFNQPQPQMFTSFCHNVPLFKHMVQTDV